MLVHLFLPYIFRIPLFHLLVILLLFVCNPVLSYTHSIWRFYNITLVLNIIIGLVGENTLAELFTGIPVMGEIIAALVGLIPNCASSVVITQLYLDQIIGAGAMMAGLLVNAGVGLLVLFRLNKNRKENLKIVGALYVLGVFWGVVIELLGIVF